MSKEKITTVGTISELYSYSNGLENQKFLNEQQAVIKYEVGGKTYYSENRIFVPLNSQLGDTIKINYDKNQPTKIFQILFQKN